MKRLIAVLLMLVVGSGFVFASTSKTCSNGHMYTGSKCSHCYECAETYTKNGYSSEWQKQCLPQPQN